MPKARDRRPWRERLDAKWLRRWTIRLGVASWVVLALPVLTVFALISIVGIPLAIAMMATPPIFVVLAIASIVQKILGRDGTPAVAASVGIALLVLAGVAAIANARLDLRADAFLSGDVDTLARPLAARPIGLVSLGWRNQSGSRCDELCQRLLLSGAAERVVVANMKSDEKEWRADTPAFTYRIEQRDGCPAVHVAGRLGGTRIDEANPEEMMRLAIATGRCLVEEPATLAEAEAVVTTGRLQRGENDYSAGLSLFADTLTVDRASVHVREQGTFVERYRWTRVTMLRHPLIPLPTLVDGHELNMAPGFLRSEHTRNERPFADYEINVLRFVREELGIDISLTAADKAARADVIERELAAAGPVTPAVQQVIEDFFQSFMLQKQLDEPTRILAFRALADPRVVAPRETWALASASAKAGDAVTAELAGVLLRKLMTTDPAQRENHPTYLGYPATYLANAIALLPPESMRAHRRELEELARDPARRRRAHRALVQLSAFGADAVPTLMYLIDTGSALKEAQAQARSSRDAEDWKDLHRAGFAGLCRIGTDASSALEPLLARMRDGTLPIRGASELALSTLVRLGADAEQIRVLLESTVPAEDRPRFERDAERARRRPECNP